MEISNQSWNEIGKAHLSELNLSLLDTVIIEKNNPVDDATSVKFGNTGVSLSWMNLGDGMKLYHHFQPNGRESHSPKSSFDYARRYSRGLLLMLEWISNPQMYEEVLGVGQNVDTVYGSTNREMWNFRKRLLGDDCVLDREDPENDIGENYWYHIDVGSLRLKEGIRAKLLKIALRGE